MTSPTNTPDAPLKTPTGKSKAQDFAAVRDWDGYYRAVAGKPPRDTLLKALAAFETGPAVSRERLAIDVGCGSGRDTLELLRRGWRVLATDSTALAIDLLRAAAPAEHQSRLETRIVPVEHMDLFGADLVNASYSLPFCDPGAFARVWERIVAGIAPGCRFAGQLFGDRDDWAALPDRSHQTRSQVEAMFSQFVLESFVEEEKHDGDALGNPKDWHVFHVVPRKRT